MDLAAFNKEALLSNKPTCPLKNLPRDLRLPIISVKIVKGQYGKSVLLELEDKVVFLPNRVTNLVQGKTDTFTPNKYSLIYRGSEQIGKHECQQFEIVET